MTKNEPVLLNGTAASLAAAATPVLIAAGLSSEAAGRWGSLVGAGLAFMLVVANLVRARAKVTPVAKLPQPAAPMTVFSTFTSPPYTPAAVGRTTALADPGGDPADDSATPADDEVPVEAG